MTWIKILEMFLPTNYNVNILLWLESCDVSICSILYSIAYSFPVANFLINIVLFHYIKFITFSNSVFHLNKNNNKHMNWHLEI